MQEIPVMPIRGNRSAQAAGILPDLAPLRMYFPYLALFMVIALSAWLSRRSEGVLQTGLAFASLPLAAILYRLVIRGQVRNSAHLFQTNQAASRADGPRISVLTASLRELSGDPKAEILITPNPSVLAACHWRGDFHFVEIALGFLKRYAKGADWRSGDLPQEVQAMLAHEAGHIKNSDPARLLRLLAALLATLSASAYALVFSLTFLPNPVTDIVQAGLQALALILTWTVLVAASEIEADHYGAEKIGRPLAAKFLERQRYGLSRFTGMAGWATRFVRHHLQPSLDARAGLDPDAALQLRHNSILALGMGAFLASATLSARLLTEWSGILQFVVLVSSLLLIFFPVFHYRSLRKPSPDLPASFSSMLGSMAFAIPYVLIATLTSTAWNTERPMMFFGVAFVGFALALYTWSAAQAGAAYRARFPESGLPDFVLAGTGFAGLAVLGAFFVWVVRGVYGFVLIQAAKAGLVGSGAAILAFPILLVVSLATAACAGILAQVYNGNLPFPRRRI